jgi:hypothetical protein
MPSCNYNPTENRMTNHDPIPARLAALKTTPTPDLKVQWRDLFETEPPPFIRRYLESRLAYRIQELAYGGLKPETIRRLERMGEEMDGGDRKKRASRFDRDRPIIGTWLAELAAKEGLAVSYLARVLRMAQLAPDIVEAIVVGRRPSDRALAHLLEPFPLGWGEQVELLRSTR